MTISPIKGGQQQHQQQPALLFSNPGLSSLSPSLSLLLFLITTTMDMAMAMDMQVMEIQVAGVDKCKDLLEIRAEGVVVNKDDGNKNKCKDRTLEQLFGDHGRLMEDERAKKQREKNLMRQQNVMPKFFMDFGKSKKKTTTVEEVTLTTNDISDKENVNPRVVLDPIQSCSEGMAFALPPSRQRDLKTEILNRRLQQENRALRLENESLQNQLEITTAKLNEQMNRNDILEYGYSVVKNKTRMERPPTPEPSVIIIDDTEDEMMGHDTSASSSFYDHHELLESIEDQARRSLRYPLVRKMWTKWGICEKCGHDNGGEDPNKPKDNQVDNNNNGVLNVSIDSSVICLNPRVPDLPKKK